MVSLTITIIESKNIVTSKILKNYLAKASLYCLLIRIQILNTFLVLFLRLSRILVSLIFLILIQYFTQFGHMAELSESELILQKTFKKRYFA
jgi:hypothetical protein